MRKVDDVSVGRMMWVDKRFLGQIMRRAEDVQAGAYMRIFWRWIKFEIYYPHDSRGGGGRGVITPRILKWSN